ncbi:MAG: 4-(cytidine 5'-diphospho)-2-C-methyl-D-erythritol kinase [Vicingus serpentipes]|nr:4-(cytidine 5'-diphospho)-2-C-methyl-D-erythritol kinase [Vicingus serpentipes]
MIVFPNAKINIGLHIVEKRSDGFHNLESIFYPVTSLYDVLEVVKSSGNELEFTSSGIDIPGDDTNNLCVQAYTLLKKDYDLPLVKIHLHKVIPIGAGLGGGSADAAFMLKALNELFELQLSDNVLMGYARQLGSDCAFFIKNKSAYTYHKGDELETIDLDLSDYDIRVEYPNIHIGTAEAYAGVTPKPSVVNLKEIIQQPVTSWKGIVENDFEQSIFPRYPKIEALKKKMYEEGALYASMTGSGSAVFGIFKK